MKLSETSGKSNTEYYKCWMSVFRHLYLFHSVSDFPQCETDNSKIKPFTVNIVKLKMEKIIHVLLAENSKYSFRQ